MDSWALVHFVVDGLLGLVVFLLHREVRRIDATEEAARGLHEDVVRLTEQHRALERTHEATRAEFSGTLARMEKQLERILDRLEEGERKQ